MFLIRYDFAQFMKMDEKENKATIDAMLSTLPSDDKWNLSDPYEALCAAGKLVRYTFGGLASSSTSTALIAESKESFHVQSDFIKVNPNAIENGDGLKVDIIVKTEHEEEKALTEKLKEVNKQEREVSSLVNALKKTKSLLLSCKKKEGSDKATECQKMVASLDKLQEELLNHAAIGEAIDKGDKNQMLAWLKTADELCDLAVNTAALAKGAKGKFSNYLSS